MIELDNYKRAIQWLKQHADAYSREPENAMYRDGLVHSFETLYTVTETRLRHALTELTGDSAVAQLSSRELMRYAEEEGLYLTSAQSWLEYGIAIERANESLCDATSEIIAPIIPRYLDELEKFSELLSKRLGLHV